jgi:hypothetical protein
LHALSLADVRFYRNSDQLADITGGPSCADFVAEVGDGDGKRSATPRCRCWGLRSAAAEADNWSRCQ